VRFAPERLRIHVAQIHGRFLCVVA
jgi:hypothetical protein